MDLFDSEGLRHDVARDGAEMSAQLAESVAGSFERLADTYRRMADRAYSPDKAVRLRGHVTRLEYRAGRERTEARRIRSQIELRSGD